MIKKILLFLFIFLSFLNFSKAESIKKYEVNLELQKDSSVLVEEKITYDFGNNSKHGIYRFIPIFFSVKNQEKYFGLMKRKLEISNLKVYRDGVTENIAELKKKDSNGNFFVKIGRKHFVINGIHQYIIKYKVNGSLRYFDDYDEIYWNATGLDWEYPIEKVIVNISSNIDNLKFKNKACYQGKNGSNEKCNISGNTFNSTKVLSKGEGLTVAASFDKNLVQKKELWEFSKIGWIALILSFLISAVSVIWYYSLKYLNKFKPNNIIIPIYGPYKNYHPSLTGFLIDGKFDNRDITAGIINLAQKGFVKIEKIEKDGFIWGKKIDYKFIFNKNKEIVEIDELDKMFLEILFTEKKVLSFEYFVEKMNDYSNSIANGEKKKFDKNKLLDKILLSKLSDKSSEIQASIIEITKWFESYSIKNNFLKKIKMNIWIVVVLVGSFIASIVMFINEYVLYGAILISLYSIMIIAIVFLKYRYTKRGWEVKNNLLGFKMFLEFTEKERLKFFNSPKNNPQEYLEYLPYAIAFDVEKEWKEQFKDITIPKPDWYAGGSDFAASSLASDISNISSAVNSSVSSMTSSGSGSSGGGSSGGGSGGGGGGSW